MKKDLNWFKKQLDDIEMNTPKLSFHDSIWVLNRVHELIDQLDEVEEEQKYVVEIGKSIYNTTTYGQIGEVNGQKIMLSVYASDEGMIIPNKYTKQEILKVKNGMVTFKDYAVKVEELEE